MDIKEILARGPESLLALSDTELATLLAPFFPAVRATVMPPEKARKLGLDRRMLESYIAASKDDLLKKQKEMQQNETKH